MRKIHIILLLIALLSGNILYAQYTNSAYHQYIEQYKDMAQEQMRKHGIPASITLAQGLLESGAGRSELATKANNHFGIKVGMGWNGPYVIKSDDRPDDRFRKYNNAAESFEDHSQFLLKPRYASLFKLSPTDYKGWARGLKQCGYATSPTYAEQLITIIENYKLHQYDNLDKKHRHADDQQPSTQVQSASSTTLSMRELAEQAFFAAHPVQACNGNYYIVTQPGDDLATISLMTNVSKRKLRKYNELPNNYTPQAGDILYLQKKKSHADKSLKGTLHTIQSGESMHDIAQRYGIRLESLYKLNSLDTNYAPQPGQMLRIY